MKNYKNVKSVKMIVENGVKILNYCKRCNKINEDCKCVKLYINQTICKSSSKVSAQSVKKQPCYQRRIYQMYAIIVTAKKKKIVFEKYKN